MTQSGGSNAIVNVMLGWLKGLASWVLRLFNLSGGFSPLKFLADNWLKLLILFLIIGLAADLVIWLVRWRPHWVWFHKKRVIINDRNFFAEENEPEADEEDMDWDLPEEFLPREREDRSRRDWQDNDYVVAGASRRRAEARRRGEREAKPAADAPAPAPGDVFTDERFDINANQKHSDRYEDEVFDVSDLPEPETEQVVARRKPKGSSSRRGGRRESNGRRSGARR